MPGYRGQLLYVWPTSWPRYDFVWKMLTNMWKVGARSSRQTSLLWVNCYRSRVKSSRLEEGRLHRTLGRNQSSHRGLPVRHWRVYLPCATIIIQRVLAHRPDHWPHLRLHRSAEERQGLVTWPRHSISPFHHQRWPHSLTAPLMGATLAQVQPHHRRRPSVHPVHTHPEIGSGGHRISNWLCQANVAEHDLREQLEDHRDRGRYQDLQTWQWGRRTERFLVAGDNNTRHDICGAYNKAHSERETVTWYTSPLSKIRRHAYSRLRCALQKKNWDDWLGVVPVEKLVLRRYLNILIAYRVLINDSEQIVCETRTGERPLGKPAQLFRVIRNRTM